MHTQTHTYTYPISHKNENNENSFDQKVWYDYIGQKKKRKECVCMPVSVLLEEGVRALNSDIS